MDIIGGFQDTRTNNEDLAITPYLFVVFTNGTNLKIYGIGICFLYYAFYIGVGFGIPKDFPRFLWKLKSSSNE